jgi:predicted alpha/beta-fold hydrolase
MALNIKIPTLAIHSKDDPVCSDIAVPYGEFAATPYIVMAASSIGGHLGFFEFSGERWSDKMVSLSTHPSIRQDLDRAWLTSVDSPLLE